MSTVSYDPYGRASPTRLHGASPASVTSATAKGKAELLQLAVSESKGEIQSLRANVGTLQDTISGHARTLQQYKVSLREKDEENRALHQSVVSMKRELTETRKGNDEGDRAHLKYNSLSSKLQQELDDVRGRCARYRQDLELAVERKAAAEAALEDLRRAHAQLGDELLRSQELLRRQSDEGTSRESQLQRVATTSNRQLEEVTAELRELRVKSTEYQVALQERERELQALQERTRQQGMESLQGHEEVVRLRRQVSETGLQNSTYTERLQSLEQSRRQLESEVDGWCSKHDEATRRSEDLQRQIEDRVGEIERLQRSLHGKESELEDLRDRARHQASGMGELEAGHRSLEKQLQERIEHISYLEAKLTGHEKEIFDRTAKCDELSRERASFIQQVEKLNADLDEAHAEILRTREEASIMREQSRNDQEELRRQASATKGELSQARAKIAQLEGRLTTVDDFRADLQAQLRDAEAQAHQFQARMAEQRRELTEWGSAIVKLQGEKDDVIARSELNDQERMSLAAQVSRLQNKSNEQREELRMVRDESQAHQELGLRKDHEIESLQRNLEDRLMQIGALEDKLEKSTRAIAERTREIRLLHQQLEDERNQISSAGIELTRLEGRVATKEEEALTYKDKNAQLKDHIHRLEAQMRRLEPLPQVIDTQEAELERLRRQIARMEDDAQNQLRSMHALQQRLSEKDAASDSAQMKMSEFSMELQNMARLKDELEVQLSEKGQEIIRLKGSLARLEGKVDALDDAHHQWEIKCNQLDVERETLRRQLDLASDERNAMERELNMNRDRTETLEHARDSAERQANERSLSVLRNKEELEKLREANQHMGIELQRLRQLAHLPQVLEHKEQEVRRLQETLQMIELQAGSNVSAVRDLSGRTAELEALLADRDREASELTRELHRKVQDSEQAMNEVLTKTNEVNRLRASLARLEGKFQVMTEANEDEKGKSALLEDELRTVRSGIDPLFRHSSASAAGLVKESDVALGAYSVQRRFSAMSGGSTAVSKAFSPLKREDYVRDSILTHRADSPLLRGRETPPLGAPITARAPYQSRFSSTLVGASSHVSSRSPLTGAGTFRATIPQP
ncbi:hypothetical protein DIPPA_01223 [Diplonema papillatum]|nr:hypothetical protein DIPPA_01223 [Diplonema papillatum]